MSANIYWRPANHGERLPIDQPSKFIIALGVPCTLTYATLPMLRALLVAEFEIEAVQDLITAIENHDEVQVYAEY